MNLPRRCDCPALPVARNRVGRPCLTCDGLMPALDDVDHRILRYEARPLARVRRLRSEVGKKG